MDKLNKSEFDILVDIDNRMRQIVGHLKTEIHNRLSSVPFKGELISDGKDGRPLIGIIKFSQLDKTDNWTPDYHFSKMQAKAVSICLENCTTAKQLLKAVEDMLTKKYVLAYPCKFKYALSDRVYLNEDTLEILRNSEIGRYIAERVKKKKKKRILSYDNNCLIPNRMICQELFIVFF